MKKIKSLIVLFLLQITSCSQQYDYIEYNGDGSVLYNNIKYFVRKNHDISIPRNGEKIEIGRTKGILKEKFYKSSLDKDCNIIYSSRLEYFKEGFSIPDVNSEYIYSIKIGTYFDELLQVENYEEVDVLIDYSKKIYVYNIFEKYDVIDNLYDSRKYFLQVTINNFLYFHYSYVLSYLNGELYVSMIDYKDRINDEYKNIFIDAINKHQNITK